MKTSLFINEFAKGSKENQIVGMGAIVGIDTYSKKGVARLAKKSTTITTGFTGMPTFIEVAGGGVYIWVQCDDGKVLASSDGGNNFSDTSFPSVSNPEFAQGNGMIYFQGYIFAFTNNSIYYHNADPASGSWSSAWKTSLQTLNSSPIANLHTPFLYPSSSAFYFCNGNSIGKVGQVGTTTFNPAGSAGTDYIYNASIFTLPSLTYTTTSLEFLPPANLAIAAYSYQNPSQGADLITWDTVSPNKFNPPLRMYTDSLSNGTTMTGGIKQLISRNQVLYAIAGGNHAIYETNGSTFNLVNDIALFSSVRSSLGAETDSPVFFNSYPQAIAVVGNKLLTGVATTTNNASLYPPASTGIFPIGVWSVAFNQDGSKSTQCEFVLPIGDTLIAPSGDTNFAKITAIKAISSVSNSTNQIAVGFGHRSTALGSTFGIILIDLFQYINNIALTAIESELFEIGTPLNPQTVNNIELNFVKPLLTGQSFDVYYRTGIANNWVTIKSGLGVTSGDGTKANYKFTSNDIGPTQFLQLRVRMATGGSSQNTTYSPELKTVIIS